MKTQATHTEENTQPTLVAIIYGLAEILMTYTRAIADDQALPWNQRERAVNRLNRVLQQLLGLTIRMDPRKLGQAAFALLRRRPQSRTESRRPPNDQAAPTPSPRRRVTLLSARRIAHRLAALLREIDAVAQEIGRPIPLDLEDLCEQARTEAGCHALHPTTHYDIKPEPDPESQIPPPWRTLEL